jgi:hypothetical protein
MQVKNQWENSLIMLTNIILVNLLDSDWLKTVPIKD